MTTVNLTPELHELLEKLAVIEELPLENLVEGVLMHYVVDHPSGIVLGPTAEELAAVKVSIAEDEASGVWYSLEEVEAEIDAMLQDEEFKLTQEARELEKRAS